MLEITKVSEHLGAEVTGVDVSRLGDQRAKLQSIPTGSLRARGTGWHTDPSYEDQPAKATQLYPIIMEYDWQARKSA